MASILAVDNENILVEVIRADLEHAGHYLKTVRSGAEAFQRAAQMSRIDLLILFHEKLPHHGRDIAECLLVSHPHMKILQISGFSREHLEAEGNLAPGAAFLAKPFTVSWLRDTVTALVASRRPSVTRGKTGYACSY